jgi:hypothetical protein
MNLGIEIAKFDFTLSGDERFTSSGTMTTTVVNSNSLWIHFYN